MWFVIDYAVGCIRVFDGDIVVDLFEVICEDIVVVGFLVYEILNYV